MVIIEYWYLILSFEEIYVHIKVETQKGGSYTNNKKGIVKQFYQDTR